MWCQMYYILLHRRDGPALDFAGVALGACVPRAPVSVIVTEAFADFSMKLIPEIFPIDLSIGPEHPFSHF